MAQTLIDEAMVCLDQWGRTPKTKMELVDDAKTKDVQRFFQIDVWDVGIDGGDDVMEPDDDGHCITARNTYDLRRSPPDLKVRVQISSTATKSEAIAMLEKMVEQTRDVIGGGEL